jgi:hypothetical protein
MRRTLETLAIWMRVRSQWRRSEKPLPHLRLAAPPPEIYLSPQNFDQFFGYLTYLDG